MNKQLINSIKSLTALKILFAFLYALTVFSHPHVIRQTDTLATTFRYWQRWVLERDLSFIPAVLNAGDGHGIQSMEFPLINVIFANSFFFGIDFGRILAQLGLTILSLFLTMLTLRVWKKAGILEEKSELTFLLILITSISSTYFYRFMPDYISFILITLAVGLSITNNRPLSWTVCSIGLLLKPTSIIALGPLLLYRNFKSILKKDTLWIGGSILVACIYYTLVVKYLRNISDQPEYFYTEFRNPITSLFSFVLSPNNILRLVIKNLFGKFLIIPILIFYLLDLIKNRSPRLTLYFLVLVLQIITIAMLDGDHSFIHDYYFIGTSFTCTLITAEFLLKAPKLLKVAFFIILTSTTIDRGIYEIKPLFSRDHWNICRELREKNSHIPWGQAYPFRSANGPVPYAGLCFGEKQGSLKGKYGIYMPKDTVPEGCDIIDQDSGIKIASCLEVK